MRGLALRFCQFVFLILALCLSVTARAETFKIEEFFLDNGLQVVVIENHKSPIIQQMLFYKVGAVDEKIGKGGIAHLLEHLMFRGTSNVKGQKFNRIMEENGAESNAFTAQDVTAYHQFLDISRLELAMYLEADRMRGLKISESDFETERDIVFQERKQRVDNNPAAKFYEKIRHVLWQDHPYGNPITGQEKEILNLTRDDALSFYRQYYAPNNAVLVLSGDIDLATAKELVVKYYGKIKSSDLKKLEFENLPNNYRARVEMELPDVKLGRMVKMFAAPSFNQDKKVAYALEILGEYLTGDKNAPLYQKLVIKDKKALDVSAGYDGVSRSYGSFVLSVVPSGDIDARFENVVEDAVRYSMKIINEEKISKVKQKMLSELVYLMDNPSSLAQLVGYMAATGMKVQELNSYADNIRNVSLDDVRAAFDVLWNKAPQVTGVLQPEDMNNE